MVEDVVVEDAAGRHRAVVGVFLAAALLQERCFLLIRTNTQSISIVGVTQPAIQMMTNVSLKAR